MLTLDISMTIGLFIIFIGIILWAWSPGRKQDFSEAAHLALEDDNDSVKPNNVPGGRTHG